MKASDQYEQKRTWLHSLSLEELMQLCLDKGLIGMILLNDSHIKYFHAESVRIQLGQTITVGDDVKETLERALFAEVDMSK